MTHTEAVLLVRDDQPQVSEGSFVRHQCVGADDEVQLPHRDFFPDHCLVLWGQRARQQTHTDAQGLQQRPQTCVMLLRQDLRGRHQCRLAAVGDGQVSGGSGSAFSA